MELTCLRHAESANVVAGASGAVPDAPLTDRGREQARLIGSTLAARTVYASSALRAVRTAELLGGDRAFGQRRWRCSRWPVAFGAVSR